MRKVSWNEKAKIAAVAIIITIMNKTRRSCLDPNSALFSGGQIFLLPFALEKSRRKFLWREGYILLSLLTRNVIDLVETLKTIKIKFYINKNVCNKYMISSVCIKLFSFLTKCYFLFYCNNFDFKKRTTITINSYTITYSINHAILRENRIFLL